MAAEGDASFVHFWKIGLGPGVDSRMTELLVTAKDYAVHEFNLKLTSSRDDLDFLVRRNNAMPNHVQLVLEPSLRSYSIRTPKMKSCRFDMVVKKLSGEVLMGPYHYECNPKFELHDPSVRLPIDSPLAIALPTAMALKTPDAYMVITTTMLIPSSIFALGQWPLAASPPPLNRGFTFDVIANKAKHNVRLLCNGGVYSANKTALFHSSLYFRRLFAERRSNVEFVEDASLQAVEIVITYMFTGTFLTPVSVTPSLISDICRLVRRFHVMGPRDLLQAVEKEASLQLIKEEDDLEKVLHWLITASEHEMTRLENTVNAILLTKHANQVMVEYTGSAARFTRQKQKLIQQFEYADM